MTKEKGFRHEEEAVLLLNKGKQGIVHLIFGRTGVIILLLAVQIVLLVLASMFWRWSLRSLLITRF